MNLILSIAVVLSGVIFNANLRESITQLEGTVTKVRQLPASHFKEQYCQIQKPVCDIRIRRLGEVVALCDVKGNLPNIGRYWRLRCGAFVTAQFFK